MGTSHESIEFERTFLCKIGQTVLLTFKLRDKSILKTQIERISAPTLQAATFSSIRITLQCVGSIYNVSVDPLITHS